MRNDTANQILHLLKRDGPSLAADLARHLGIGSEAARQQLVKLSEDDLVQSVPDSKPGRGRPKLFWSLTDEGHAAFPDGHGELSTSLVRLMRDTLGDAALDAVIAAREIETLVAYRNQLSDAPDLPTRIERLAIQRSREGYMADWWQEADGSWILAENHCPICATATLCQGFCRSELKIFRDVLQAPVERVEHIVEGARRCAYRVG